MADNKSYKYTIDFYGAAITPAQFFSNYYYYLSDLVSNGVISSDSANQLLDRVSTAILGAIVRADWEGVAGTRGWVKKSPGDIIYTKFEEFLSQTGESATGGAFPVTALEMLEEWMTSEGITIKTMPELGPTQDIPYYTNAVAEFVGRQYAESRGWATSSNEYKGLIDAVTRLRNEPITQIWEAEEATEVQAWNERQIEQFYKRMSAWNYVTEANQAAAKRQAEIEKSWSNVGFPPQAKSTPQVPDATELIEKFLNPASDRAPNFQAWMESKISDVVSEFDETGARQRWAATLARPSYEADLKRAEIALDYWEKQYMKSIVAATPEGLPGGESTIIPAGGYYTDPTLNIGEATAGEWMENIAPYRYAQAKKAYETLLEQGEEGYSVPTSEDPLKAYLEEYPWREEWLKLSPSKRGYYPQRYAPAARWFTA